MITRAYTNANDERQEVTLSAGEWEELTEEALQELLGFKAAKPAKATKTAKAEPAAEPVVEAAPAAEEAPAVDTPAAAE